MHGFREPTHPDTRRRGSREAIAVVLTAVAILLVFEGPSIRETGEGLEPGVLRAVVLAVGEPAGWVADRLPLADVDEEATAWLSPDDDLDSDVAGFAGAVQALDAGAVPPVAPEAFDPRELGERVPEPRALRHVLVTGDSMAQPLDSALARRLADGRAIQVSREPHLGTAISRTDPVDWAKLARRQADRERADAVIMFLGANEGFPMTPAGATGALECCGVKWAAEYAFRVRQIMNTFRRDGEARVFWLTLPLPRDPDRVPIARAVNAAIRVAVAPYRAHARVIEMEPLFTPGGRFRESMPVAGRNTLVREADGIHLNDAGAGLAAETVLRALRSDFRVG